MVSWFKKLFCNHDYEYINKWEVFNNSGQRIREERVYLCKKCMKLKKIKY